METNPGNAALTILVVDDEPNIRKMLSISLTTDGHRATTANTASDALGQVSRQAFDMAFVDLRLGTETGLDLIPRITAESPWTKVVVITAYASVDTAVEAMKRGATDYLPKPFTPVQVRLVVERVARLRALELRVAGLQEILGENNAEVTFDSASPRMRQAVDLARQVAQSDATLLLRGESGTGKGVLAKAVHSWSDRAEKPFATVSCPALSPELLESELFGHAKGSFTGAIRDNPGRIASSEGGTLFLDEIGDLPLRLQPKLLRFVQDREYERVGESSTRRANVRMITATNVDLAEAVRAGRFREDLLYRINVIQIELPPLRERQEDIAPIAQRMLVRFARRPIEGFTAEAAAALKNYSWPGNLRELRNVVERATILCRGERIGLEHLPVNFGPAKGTEPKLGDPVPFDQIEAVHIRRVIAASKTMDEAAQTLGVDAATLWRKRKKHGI
ncbi:MAG: sigma-54-dependent transcriptional regulator [Tepidisphaerales bacterium]